MPKVGKQVMMLDGERCHEKFLEGLGTEKGYKGLYPRAIILDCDAFGVLKRCLLIIQKREFS